MPRGLGALGGSSDDDDDEYGSSARLWGATGSGDGGAGDEEESAEAEDGGVLAARYGIGAKLLAGMGWKRGEGLGKQGTGISEPIQVKVRPKNAGLAYNMREKTGQQLREEQRAAELAAAAVAGRPHIEHQHQSSKQQQQQQQQQHKRTHKERKKNEESGGEQPQPQNLAEKPQKEDDSPLAPFLNNVQLLVQSAADKARRCAYKVESARRSVEQLQQQCQQDQAQLEEAQREREAAAHFVNAISSDAIGESPSCAVLSGIKQRFPAQWSEHGVDEAALDVAREQLTKQMEEWTPLFKHAAQLSRAFAEWRQLFGVRNAVFDTSDSESDSSDDDGLPPTHARIKTKGQRASELVDSPQYEQLLDDTLLPVVRHTVLGWSPVEHAEAMADCVEWLARAVLTSSARQVVVDQLVYPRLLERVREWRPETDAVPVEAWLLPWFRVLGPDQRDAAWSLVSQKIAAVLRHAWTTPLDTSALTVLKPWKAAADPRRFSSLLMTSVVPKLRRALSSDIEVAPAAPPSATDAALMRATADWLDVLPLQTLAALLAAAFFPRWLACVRGWLQQPGTDFAAVAVWYKQWRALLPDFLVACPAVQQHLAEALDMLDRAMDGDDLTLPAQVVVSGHKQPQPQRQTAATTNSTTETRSGEDGNGSSDLRDVLEQFATTAGIEFVPTRRVHDGLTVYKFGRTSVVLDARVVRALDVATGTWRAVLLADLLAQNSITPAGRVD